LLCLWSTFLQELKAKAEQLTLGFRVKSGWASAILLAGPARAPRLRDSRVIDLSDPRFPATRQPYHASMGMLESDSVKLNARLRIVRRVTKQSVAGLLADCRSTAGRIQRAGLVVGSQIDPELIANPHIRAHALEGQLFRTALVDALRAHGIRCMILTERDAFVTATNLLKKSPAELQRAVKDLGQSAGGPWRAEQKLAALAAWVAMGA
jgi:hypothetical protein